MDVESRSLAFRNGFVRICFTDRISLESQFWLSMLLTSNGLPRLPHNWLDQEPPAPAPALRRQRIQFYVSVFEHRMRIMSGVSQEMPDLQPDGMYAPNLRHRIAQIWPQLSARVDHTVQALNTGQNVAAALAAVNNANYLGDLTSHASFSIRLKIALESFLAIISICRINQQMAVAPGVVLSVDQMFDRVLQAVEGSIDTVSEGLVAFHSFEKAKNILAQAEVMQQGGQQNGHQNGNQNGLNGQ